jgi:hypothetical protein
MACASIDELSERVLSIARELPQYRLSFALVCETVLNAVAQYPLGATRAILLSELLDRAVAISERQLVTAARSLAFSALCTFDVVAVVPLAHDMRLVALRVADRPIDAVSDDEDDDDSSGGGGGGQNDNENSADDEGASVDDIPQLLRFVPSRKLVPFLAFCRSILVTAIHFGVQDSRLILPTPAVVPVLDSPDVLCAAPFSRQRLSLLQLVTENNNATAMVMLSPAYFLKCDVVQIAQNGTSILVSDGTLEGAGDAVRLVVREPTNPILSLLRVGDILVLIDFAFHCGALVLRDECSVLFRLRERREPLISAASVSASGASVALFGSPVASGASGASALGSPQGILSPSGSGVMRAVPRNAKGERDFEHVNRITNMHDLRRGHVNVSLLALVDCAVQHADDAWPLSLRVRDSQSSASVYLSAKFALAARSLLGGEMVYMQNVSARSSLTAGNHKAAKFMLDEAAANTKLVVVSQIANLLVTPSVCKPRTLAWLIERARSARRRRRPVEHAAIHARITALQGVGRGETCGASAHAVCERALVFSTEHRSLCCPACGRPVQQNEISTVYTLQCTVAGSDGSGERISMTCALRNSAAYHLLGMTAAQHELLDEQARAQLHARAVEREYAMFVVLVPPPPLTSGDDNDTDDEPTFRIDSVTLLRAD